ncbi:Fc receptor-like protein 6 isoform X5 [Camelus bactrianus]|uniref:Fc receptor-like protein 6 isoform X5 n=1 Tax=Camelus bactrianus TaxID=9837 RepID=A0AC58P6W3_CAMBA
MDGKKPNWTQACQAWLKLQVSPNPVFEGDVLTLQCWGGRNAALSQVHFFRDGKLFHFSKDNQPLSMGTATVKSSGRYSCAGQVTSGRHVNNRTSGTVMVQVQELFPPPVLSAIPSHEPCEGSPVTLRCQTKLHPKRLASGLLLSFHKEDHTLQDRGLHPELSIPAAQEGDSGRYWCEAAPEGGRVQKQSPWLEIRVWAPVSSPLLTLRPRPTGLTVGYGVELLCEAQRGSPPILYSFYLNGEMLGNPMALRGGAASFLFLVKSEQDAGNYTCKAENRVSEETSKPETLSVDGPRVLSAPTSTRNWLLPWLPASLLGGTVIAAALLGYFRPWRKNAHFQNGEDAGVVYAAVRTTPKKSEAKPAESSQQEEDFSVIYAEVRCPQLSEVPAQGLNRSSRTHQDPTGDHEEVLRQ